jgi:endoglucanase
MRACRRWAARAARLLEPYDKAQASEYRRSALKAMAWAEGEWPRVQAGIADGTIKPETRQLHDMPAARGLAALELYRLTGEPEWHELFLSTTQLTDPNAPLFNWAKYDDRYAAIAYALMPETLGTPEVRAAARKKLIDAADAALAYQAGNAFELSSEGRVPQHMGFYTVPQAMAQVRAHAITGEAKYLESIVRASNFSAGANPTGYVFTTGIGANPVRRPLHVDSMASAQPAPAGITVYGAFDFDGPMQRSGIFWVGAIQRFDPHTKPPTREWPAVEMYFDVSRWIAVNEYTVWQTMGPNSYVWGYLAGQKRSR